MSEINKEISAKTGLRLQAVEKFLTDNNIDGLKLLTDLGHKKLKAIDLATAISGNPGNKYSKEIIRKYMKESKILSLIKKVIKEERRKLKEFNTEDEIEHIATNLLDYLGGEVENLPNWRADRQIVNFFRDNAITDQRLAGKIYHRALELSQENAPKPKSRKYLDN